MSICWARNSREKINNNNNNINIVKICNGSVQFIENNPGRNRIFPRAENGEIKTGMKGNPRIPALTSA